MIPAPFLCVGGPFNGARVLCDPSNPEVRVVDHVPLEEPGPAALRGYYRPMTALARRTHRLQWVPVPTHAATSGAGAA